MSLPPPKLRNLASMIQDKDSEKQEVWEVGVPAKRSLFWSVMLSYLISCSDEQFVEFLNKIKCPQTTTKGKQSRRLSRSCSSSARLIKKMVGSFNPFKNRHAFFYLPDIIIIFQDFKRKLNQYAYELKLKLKSDEWNDAFKLKAAAELLNCKLEIYFPDNIRQKPLCFSSSVAKETPPLLILFQYEDQPYGSRKEDISIFRFAMTTEYAHNLKLDALAHILKIAKLTTCEPKNIQKIMNSAETHGINFLPTLLQSRCYDALPDLYKSPYIALKLSEAGFETNPTDTDHRKPSPFLYAMTKSNTKYIRILYDYAVNCRYLFDKTVRDADDTVLKSIQELYTILENDKLQITEGNLKITGKEQTLSEIFSHFNKFQQEIVTADFALKTELHKTEQKSHSLKSERAKAGKEILNIRKQIIESILESYSNFFHYKLDEMNSILDKYDNYINFTEYYENIDYFSCLLFFDNIHLLKKIFQIKNEDIYANVESTFFFLIVSSKYFPQYEHDIMCKCVRHKAECESNRNTLRIIPLLYRENLNIEIENFKERLMSEESLVPKEKITEDNLRSYLSSFPVIRDELLIARMKKYLNASSQIILEEDGIKGILAIERALQVIGESVKPQSTKYCVVSCLLGSRIPQKIKNELTSIRDDLSHYKSVLADGRLEIEQNIEFFTDLQSELEEIRKAFEIVAFTQYLSLEEYLIERGQEELEKHQLGQNFIDNFLQDFKRKLIVQRKEYGAYQTECIKLSLNIISDFRTHISEYNREKAKDKTKYNAATERYLTSIEYLFLFMSKFIDEEFFNSFLQEIRECYQKYKSKKELNNFKECIESLFERYIEFIKSKFTLKDFSNSLLNLPTTQSFLKRIISKSIDAPDMSLILQAVKNSYGEAVKAKDELKNLIKLKDFNYSDKEELLLRRLIICPRNLKNLRDSYRNRKEKQVLKELEKPWLEKDKLLNTVKEMLEKNSIGEGEIKALLLKLTNQRHLRKRIYESVSLNESLCNRLESILIKKTQFLLSRIRDMKYILIDEDDEISAAWTWGRSKGIKYHMKFLMRQRFIRETPVRAALEMALFDCFNILQREDFKEMYEKLNNLFTGMNLRNVLAHGHSLLETTCGLIDEDDLSSEFINKMLDLIEDSDVIASMLKLIPCSDTLEKETFENWIESIVNNPDTEDNDTFKEAAKKVTGCQRWRSYLYLLPLV